MSSSGEQQFQRKYEEYAYILDFMLRGKSNSKRKRRHNHSGHWRGAFNPVGITWRSKYEF
jgi:predicted nucleic acid-binding OB-fold protein